MHAFAYKHAGRGDADQHTDAGIADNHATCYFNTTGGNIDPDTDSHTNEGSECTAHSGRDA
jgi:hypothetical protein